jgi:hypothetical protein
MARLLRVNSFFFFVYRSNVSHGGSYLALQ